MIAEGVETESQRQLVEDIGVEQIQGYYYSKPLSMEEMEEFLKINRDGSAGRGVKGCVIRVQLYNFYNGYKILAG